jgi:hypothetical protein
MLSLLPIFFVITAALLRGGSLQNLAAVRLRWAPLAIGSFALQLLIFTPFLPAPVIGVGIPWLYLLSMLLLIAWVAANGRIPGMALMAAGLLLNVAAIAANGGHMPVAPEAARIAGTSAKYAVDGLHHNSIAIGGQAHLWLLTDIIAIPPPMPFANVFSIGDLLLTLGGAVFCFRAIRGVPRALIDT